MPLKARGSCSWCWYSSRHIQRVVNILICQQEQVRQDVQRHGTRGQACLKKKRPRQPVCGALQHEECNPRQAAPWCELMRARTSAGLQAPTCMWLAQAPPGQHGDEGKSTTRFRNRARAFGTVASSKPRRPARASRQARKPRAAARRPLKKHACCHGLQICECCSGSLVYSG